MRTFTHMIIAMCTSNIIITYLTTSYFSIFSSVIHTKPLPKLNLVIFFRSGSDILTVCHRWVVENYTTYFRNAKK